LSGFVYDEDCKPVPHAILDFFHCDSLRAYSMNVGALNARARRFNPATTVRVGTRHGNQYAARFDFVIAVD
jgi:protocatechuate 3,4-dioxygenase beta subunit